MTAGFNLPRRFLGDWLWKKQKIVVVAAAAVMKVVEVQVESSRRLLLPA
jgi:hypothetical protein